MKKYCLIGQSLGYSLSPIMHNGLFSLAGMDGEYNVFECQPHQLEEAVQKLRTEYSGANVTIPYKTAIIPYLDQITGNALKCGAVNTVINRNGQLIGDCTDGNGFIKSLPMQVKNKRVLLLGSGGAARAILAALLDNGAIVDVLNRSKQNAIQMLNDISAQGGDCFNARVVDLPMGAYSLTVNTTPLGGVKYAHQIPSIPNDIKNAGYIYDCVYSPNPTKLLEKAKEHEIPCQNGLSMLLWQGVLSQQLWGNSFNEQTVQRVYSIMEKENQK